MADFSILFNAGKLILDNVRGPKITKIDTIDIDCTLSETHSYDAEVTEYEVERGANVSDHRRTRPIEFSISGLISDTPLDTTLIEEAIALASPELGALLGDVRPVVNNLLAGDSIITRQAFDKLLSLYDDGGVLSAQLAFLDESGPSPTSRDGTFTIITKYQVYQHMVVKNLTFVRDRGSGDALPFSATFRQIRTVESATTEFNNLSPNSPVNLGSLSPPQIDETVTKLGKTNAAELFDFFTGSKFGEDLDYKAWLERGGVPLSHGAGGDF